jgi:hypothetical protein
VDHSAAIYALRSAIRVILELQKRSCQHHQSRGDAAPF